MRHDPGLTNADELLTNFLQALPLANALPKRIFVQFGQKWYGVHLGATDIPDEETDPRLDLEPNLYYTQHDILAAFCAEHKIGWNSAYPSFIIGATPDSSQSLLFPILVYASVQKYLGRPLVYPSDLGAWYAPQSLSNAMVNSYLYEWSVLAPNTANQDFNACDDCNFTWGKAWPRLAKFFDIEYAGPDTKNPQKFRGAAMGCDPPPHGRGGKSLMKYKFSFVEWAKQKENVEAWQELAKIHGLKDSEWQDVGSVFGRADFCLRRPFSSIMRYIKSTLSGSKHELGLIYTYSMTKAKTYGFFGFVDSFASILSVADEFISLNIIPDPMKVEQKQSAA